MASAARRLITHTACVLTVIKLRVPKLKSGAPFTRLGHAVMTKLQSPLAQIDLEKNQSAGGELLAVLNSVISRVLLPLIFASEPDLLRC